MGKAVHPITDSKISKLILECKGNISAMCRKYRKDTRRSVGRTTMSRRIRDSEELSRQLDEARETIIDDIETALHEKALDGDVTAMIFFLKTRGRSRGYSERIEVSGEIGLKTYVGISPDDWDVVEPKQIEVK